MHRPEPHDPKAPDLSLRTALYVLAAFGLFLLLIRLFPDLS